MIEVLKLMIFDDVLKVPKLTIFESSQRSAKIDHFLTFLARFDDFDRFDALIDLLNLVDLMN